MVGYRNSRNLFISSGILFNHESPCRGINFVTRKISLGLAKVKLGLQKNIKLGNLDAQRDWGYAKDYVEAMWSMLQQKRPQDFVVATGEMHSVREFVQEAGENLGMDIIWKGKGLSEKGLDNKTGKIIVEIDKLYFRPREVNLLCGDYARALSVLGWNPKVDFRNLVKIMVEYDFNMGKTKQVKHL